METVTQLSLLICSMQGGFAADELNDVVNVAMLHDVADHKYDFDGKLEERVRDFLWNQLYAGRDADAELAWAAIAAVSYSKENKRGTRYFESELGLRWTRIRDVVSDADKLLAIGEDGLARCWEYTFEARQHRVDAIRREKGPDAPIPAPLTPADLVQHVVEHSHDKLLRLTPEFIVTASGKFLAQPKHDEMAAILEVWKTSPPTTIAFVARP
jgi:hypothetical protein